MTLRTEEEFAAEVERHYRDTHSDGYAEENDHDEWLDATSERTHSG